MLLPLSLETNAAIYTPWTIDYATRATGTVVSRNQIPQCHNYVISTHHKPGNVFSAKNIVVWKREKMYIFVFMDLAVKGEKQ